MVCTFLIIIYGIILYEYIIKVLKLANIILGAGGSGDRYRTRGLTSRNTRTSNLYVCTFEAFIAIFRHFCHSSVMIIIVKEPIMFEHTQQSLKKEKAFPLSF